MKVSVVTVCKNSEAFIERAMKSVIEQTYKDIEYIIIDGDSQDGTREIIDQYSELLSNFVSEPDSGLYSAMNKGIKLATGEFIYFLNSDDYLFDVNVFQDVVGFISKHPDVEVVYGNVESRSVSGNVRSHKPCRPEDIAKEMICLGNCPIQPAMFFKASLFSRLGFFNESYKIAADYEWFIKLIQDEGLKLYYYPRIIVSYYCGGLSSNIKALFAEVFEIQNGADIYKSEYWLNQRIINLEDSIKKIKLRIKLFQVLLRLPGGVFLLKSLKQLRNYKNAIARVIKAKKYA